ncbi:MAG: copper resistance protein CopC [Chloroflexi bacterium]|nr:copper resistance protein CopC [Chloroflexota bacterium]
MNKFIRNAGIAVASVAAALALVSTAWGHAHTESTTPAKGAVLQTSPANVEIMFVEEIQRTAGTYGITVEKDGGASATVGSATIDAADAAHLSVALQANLAAGRYVVNWHNVSSVDGDPAEGAFSFYVKTDPTADDLAKDAALEMVGKEEMTEPTAEPAPPTVIAPISAATPQAAASPAAAAPGLPRTGDGGSATGLALAAMLALASAVAGGALLAGGLGMRIRRGR